MALTSVPERRSPVESATDQIRACFRDITDVSHSNLQRIAQLVNLYGKPAIAQELGPDAAQLAAAFTAFRDAVLLIDPDRSVEDLP